MNHEPDIWTLLFEQTPLVLRWVLGVLSVGLFTMASYIYRRNQHRMRDIEDHIDKKIREVERKMDIVNTASQSRDEHILHRLEIIDGRIVTVLHNLANGHRP